ncbi:MAG: 16S rRNA (uracil(1498)-N(3))-methyltransferase [Fibrobacter sp.]|nr:16S rRNA (uracil(1498)-N(3))-methyltransferase [Fibrobacter sp.]
MNCILLFNNDFIDSDCRCVRISGRRGEHIRNVLKPNRGDTVRVGLINDKLGTGIVESLTDDCVELTVTLDTKPPQASVATLVIALCRPKSLRKSIEVASCMGVKKIYIIESWKVEKSFWGSPMISIERLLEHAYLGLEQARDCIVPSIEFRRRFKPFIEDELPQIASGMQGFVAHPYNAQPCPYCFDKPFTLAIGPEGGFTEYEIGKFRECGFDCITTGERILRVEYAIPALLGRLGA